MTAPYRLHYAPDNASLVIRLVLAELRVPFDTVLVDRSTRQQDGAAYRALNPNGLIPVLETPAGALFETAAILLWLADTHGRTGPAPDNRALYMSWLFSLSNTLHADLRLTFYPHLYVGGDAQDQATLRATVRPRLRRYLGNLDQLAATHPNWLDPDAPTGALYYIACMMRWMALYPAAGSRDWFALGDTPNLAALLARLETRPAVHAAQSAEGLGPTPFTAPRAPTPPEGSAT